MIVNLFESISTYPFIMDKNRQTTTIDCQRIDSNITESPDRQTDSQTKHKICNVKITFQITDRFGQKKELMKKKKIK